MSIDQIKFIDLFAKIIQTQPLNFKNLMVLFSASFLFLLQGSFWLYSIILLVWYTLYHIYGDRIWWLALVSPFALLLFTPILLLLLISILPFGLDKWHIIPPTILSLVVAVASFGRQFRIPTPLFARFAKQHYEPETKIQAADKQDDGYTLSIMTFNCWWLSNPQVTASVPFLNQLPDVVLLQELMPSAAKQMNKALAQEYPYRIFDTSEEGTASRLGVLSRYPLETLPSQHLADLNFRIQIVRLTLPKGEGCPNASDKPTSILIYNIHPRATNVMRFWRGDGRFTHKVSQSFSERYCFFEKMIQDIRQRDTPVIIGGDFNSTQFSDVYRLMCEYFDDSHLEAGQYLGNTFPVHTFDLSKLPIPCPIMRLDMIFSTPTLQCVESQVGQNSGDSDHRPVVATFAC